MSAATIRAADWGKTPRMRFSRADLSELALFDISAEIRRLAGEALANPRGSRKALTAAIRVDFERLYGRPWRPDWRQV